MLYVHTVGTIGIRPLGYSGNQPFPVLGGSGDPVCPHCLCRPCIIQQPPDFLVGSSAPYNGNCVYRFRLYRRFWRLLQQIGLWMHEEYLMRKERVTARDDPREIIPKCVVKVRVHNQTSHLMVAVYFHHFSYTGDQKTLSEPGWISVHRLLSII